MEAENYNMAFIIRREARWSLRHSQHHWKQWTNVSPRLHQIK